MNDDNKIHRLNDLLGKKVPISYGSATITTTWTIETATETIRTALTHELFDWDFYYNGTTLGEEYLRVFNDFTLSPLLLDLDTTIRTYFEPCKTYLGAGLKMKRQPKKCIDDFFEKSPISAKLKTEYVQYKKEQNWTGV